MIQRRIVLRLSGLAAVSLGLAFAQVPAQAPAQTGPPILAVTGDLPMPLMLKAEDLAAMPREKAMIPEQDGTQVECGHDLIVGVRSTEFLNRSDVAVSKALRSEAPSRSRGGDCRPWWNPAVELWSLSGWWKSISSLSVISGYRHSTLKL